MKKSVWAFLVLCLIIAGCAPSTERRMELAVLSQLKQYPESTLQDIYKNFYQDRFGTGHAIADTAAARRALQNELRSMGNSLMPMVEVLGWEHKFIRINLQSVREGRISFDDLWQTFLESTVPENNQVLDKWPEEWHQIVQVMEKRHISVKNFEEDKRKIDSLLKINPRVAIHHSDIFRENYRPHYRVIALPTWEKRFGKIPD